MSSPKIPFLARRRGMWVRLRQNRRSEGTRRTGDPARNCRQRETHRSRLLCRPLGRGLPCVGDAPSARADCQTRSLSPYHMNVRCNRSLRQGCLWIAKACESQVQVHGQLQPSPWNRTFTNHWPGGGNVSMLWTMFAILLIAARVGFSRSWFTHSPAAGHRCVAAHRRSGEGILRCCPQPAPTLNLENAVQLSLHFCPLVLRD